MAENVNDMTYQPNQCERKHRLVILRKNISVQKGEPVLIEDMRYFFYLSNRSDLTAEQIVSLANGRGDQENVIEQLKNGVNAMRMPVDDLVSNGAYMVMGALAWNLKPGMACSCRTGSGAWSWCGWSSVGSCTSFYAAGADRPQRSADYLSDHWVTTIG